MTEVSGAIKPVIPSYKTEGVYDPPPLGVLNGGHIEPKIRSIEEMPTPSRPGESDALVAAVGKIFQAVTAKIAYHEREAQKLRDSLKPFAGLAPRPNVAQGGEVSEDSLRAILSLADQLGVPQS
jgi:hypothetical protein